MASLTYISGLSAISLTGWHKSSISLINSIKENILATEREAKWEKYFQGRLPLETTIIKGPADLYDAKTSKKTSSQIPNNTVVVVKPAAKYQAETLIEYKVGSIRIAARVHINNLEKPRKTTGNVPSVNDKTIKDKSLTPSGLKIAGPRIEKNNFLRIAKDSIKKNSSALPHVISYMEEILDKSTRAGMNRAIPLSKGMGISKKDIAIIAKDFGEVSGAWWFLNNFDNKLQYTEFPSAVASPLYDYIVGYAGGSIRVKVSAKANKGAAPGLISIWETIKGSSTTNTKDKKVYDFIRIATDRSISGLQSLIDCNKHYNSKAYNLIKNNIFDRKDFTVEDVENWVRSFTDANDLYKILNDNFYSKLSPRRDVKGGATGIAEILRSKPKKCGIILSPMSYSLMDEINSDNDYIDYLNKACRAISIQQIYVFLTETSLKYNVKDFESGTFIFDYHSNAGDPAANKYGFKMKT